MKKDYIKLELDKVLNLLKNEAWSDQCRENIDAVEPLYDIDDIKAQMQKTDDAFVLASKYGTPRFYRVKNVCDSAKHAQAGASLSLRELMDIGLVLRETDGLCQWFSQCSSSQTSLTFLFSSLRANKSLERRIENDILSEEELADSASPELARIRKSIVRQGLNIREQLEKIVKNQNTQKYLQENLITIRDGRYVVPVKTEYKNEIGGLVHDTSASGQTLFVEPISVVEANNEIRVLKNKEQQEIERIIAEMSAEVADFAETLIYDYENAIELEMYFAKANLAAKMKAITPTITEKPVLELNKARHPLIDKDKVVPISLRVGEDYSCLIVTGPNTGGKTVAIKTAGLLTLMAMCGLMIPASDGSIIGVFREVYADIGDEQSIAESLSTFSSHMNKIISIMREAGENSLVLLDELGSGTDPIEGAALAVSILTRLKENGCRIIATTHYQEVKIFAIQQEGVENASCEFDVNTLKPTYKFIMGVPGKSNAFAIAGKLGMADDIIENARVLVSTENKRFEEVVETLEKTRQELEHEKNEAALNARKTKEITDELQKQKQLFDEEKEKAYKQARQQAMSIVEQVRHEAEVLVDELEQLRKEKDKADFSDRVKNTRSKLNSALNSMADTANPVIEKKADDYKLPRPLKLGDMVKLADIDKKGSLLTMPDDAGNCYVLVGVMKTKTKVDNLRLIEEEKVKMNGKSVTKTVTSNMTRKSGMEIDIRGKMSDDGIHEVDKFIDECMLGGLKIITIIHGKGTGALRAAIHQYLKTNKAVKSFRLGVYGEGESGVTVVELK